MPRFFLHFSKKAKKHIDVFQMFISIANTSAHVVLRPAKAANSYEKSAG